MVKQKTKLWGKIEEIKRCTTTAIFGKKYQLKLLGVDKLLWVIAKDLSKGVVETYDTDGSLLKNGKACVDRVYVKQQESFLADQARNILLLIVICTFFLCIVDCNLVVDSMLQSRWTR